MVRGAAKHTDEREAQGAAGKNSGRISVNLRVLLT